MKVRGISTRSHATDQKKRLADIQSTGIDLHEADLFRETRARIRANAQTMSEKTGLSTQLAQLYLTNALKHDLDRLLTWLSAKAYADDESLSNIARAIGTGQGNIRNRFPDIDSLADRITHQYITGSNTSVDIDGWKIELANDPDMQATRDQAEESNQD